MVVSDPVPAVVGTAAKGTIFLWTLSRPFSWATDRLGRASLAAAALAASIGLPPPMATILSHPSARNWVTSCSTVSIFGLAVTWWNPLQAVSLSAIAMNSGAAHWRRLATIMGFLHPALCSSPGSLSRLPAPVIHSGFRQGSTLAPRPKHAWKTRQYILLSSIALTSLPGSIMPHLGWDCKMKWGGTI